MTVRETIAHSQRRIDHFLEELKEFIRFPSVSSDPKHAGAIKACAEWLAKHMRQIGLQQVKVIPTKRHPIVLGEWKMAAGRPTILIYGHFDVQPADPLDAWHSPPFEPTVRGDRLYGRGASDDKGQLFIHLKAIESLLKTAGRLPVNVICLFEGEEEIGSPNLPAFLARNSCRLRADLAVVSDTRMLGPNRPALHYAERGALSAELEIIGPSHDLHSGNFGGAVHNPLQALCEILGKLHDPNGHIAIPGFYDRVLPLTASERRYMRQAGPKDQEILRDAHAEHAWGESEFSLYERTTMRPSVSINGIVGGYQGPGGKAVIPSRAAAKLNFRLVPAQDPDEITQLFRKYVEQNAPSTVDCKVRAGHGAKPVLINPAHPAFRTAARAYQRVFRVAPVFLRSGGTIPIVNAFQRFLRMPTVLMGFALPDSQFHAPNENLHLPTFERGIATSIWFLRLIVESPCRKPVV
jgi:acetylornithine deacetylase/succinyl-diaminopimelate desuccinylase-like protein